MNPFLLPLTLSNWQIVILVMFLVVLLIQTLTVSAFFTIWLRAFLAGSPVRFPVLIAMRLRGVPASLIVDAHITSVKAGVPVDIHNLEAHHLAGGDVFQTVQAVIAAKKANLEFDWQRACALDLASKITGKSVLQELHDLL